jgi:hypothetical protein
MSAIRLLVLPLALASGACRPCFPGLPDRAEVSDVLVAGRTFDIEFGIYRLDCASPDKVAWPSVIAVGPSGEATASRGEVRALEKLGDDRFLVRAEVAFVEAGPHEVKLDFGDARKRAVGVYVAELQPVEGVIERIDGIRCLDVRRNALGTTACSSYRFVEDAGIGRNIRDYGVLIHGGQVLRTFEDDSLLYTAPHVFWKTHPDAGVERYVDDGAGSIVRRPDQMLASRGTTVAFYAEDDRAWLVRQDGLHLLALADGGAQLRIEASLTFDAGFVVAPSSVAIARGDVVYIVNNRTPYVSSTCGFRWTPANTIEEIAGSCRQSGAIAAASAEVLWLWEGALNAYEITGDELRLVDTLATPHGWANDRWIAGEYPNVGDYYELFPRRTESGLTVDAFAPYRLDSGLNDAMVPAWANREFVWYSANGYAPPRIELYERPKR